MPEIDFDIAADSWGVHPTSPAPLDTDSGAHGYIPRIRFDDTTEQFVTKVIKIPENFNAAGTVFFEAAGYPVAWVTGKKVALTLHHAPWIAGATWEVAFVEVDMAAAVVSSAQNTDDNFVWSIPAATLGWLAGTRVRIMLSRDTADVNDDLVGDWANTIFRARSV